MGAASQVIELRIPRQLRFERVARTSAAGVARQIGFSEGRIEDVKTAVGEAVINAIEHGRTTQPDPKIQLTFVLEQTRLRIEVKDPGAGFDPSRIRRPRIEDKLTPQASKRGWGLFLIQELADEYNLESAEGEGSTIAMVFHLQRMN